MNLNNIPSDLRILIDSEQTDFIIKSSRNYPRKKGLGILLFSLFWNAIISIPVVSFLVPILTGKVVNFTVNDTPTSGSLENWESILAPSLLIGLFAIIGISTFIWSLILLMQKGGYFVGTETRFIKYRNGEITVKDWEQFSGNIKINNKSKLGDLELELRTGKMKSRGKGSDKFVPDKIYISGIENVFEIEKKCRIRIKENDPTPKITTGKMYYQS